MEYLSIALASYAAVAFAKTVLSLPSIGTAARLLAKHGYAGGNVRRCIVLLVLIVPPVALLTWPVLLWNERLSFFVAYTNRQVVRQILGAMQ